APRGEDPHQDGVRDDAHRQRAARRTGSVRTQARSLRGAPWMLRRLLSSRKAFVVLLLTTASFAALFSGRATWSEIAELLKWVVGPWLAAVGIEDAAKHVASGLRGRDGADLEPPRGDPPARAKIPEPRDRA